MCICSSKTRSGCQFKSVLNGFLIFFFFNIKIWILKSRRFWQQDINQILWTNNEHFLPLVTRDPLHDLGPLEVVVTAARSAATVDGSRQPVVALGTGLERLRAKEGWAPTADRKTGSKNKQDSRWVWEEMTSSEQGGFSIQLKRWQNRMERGNKGITKETEQTSLRRNSEHRYASQIGKEGKKLSVRKRGELKMTRQTERKKKAGVACLFEKPWREARGCSRASGGKKEKKLNWTSKAWGGLD